MVHLSVGGDGFWSDGNEYFFGSRCRSRSCGCGCGCGRSERVFGEDDDDFFAGGWRGYRDGDGFGVEGIGVGFGGVFEVHVIKHLDIFSRGSLDIDGMKKEGSDSILFLLEHENPFFDGAVGVEVVNEDVFGLSDAMSTISGLVFDGSIPPRVEEDDVIGRGDIETNAAGVQADEKNFGRGIGLELVKNGFAIGGGEVTSEKKRVVRGGDVSLEEGESASVLREDDYFVVSGSGGDDAFGAQELVGIDDNGGFNGGDDIRVNGGLFESSDHGEYSGELHVDSAGEEFFNGSGGLASDSIVDDGLFG